MGRVSTSILLFLFFWSAGTENSGFAMARQNNSAAHSLLKAFASGCKSYGSWTEAALAQTHALESIINELKDKQNCNEISTALASAQNLSQEIQRLVQNPALVKLKEAQEKKRLLLIELQVSNDPVIQQVLTASIAQAEIDLAQVKAEISSSSQRDDNATLIRGLTQATTYLNSLLSDPALGRCALQYPDLGVQIGAEVLAIAGTFVDPKVGVAMASVGQLMSNLMAFIRNYRFDREIWRLQATEMAIALSCGLESMENTYCGAQDQYRLAKLEADSFPEQWKATEFWAGLHLLSYKIPGLMTWISKIASGVKPSDPSGAERQNQVWAKVNQLLSVERLTQGGLGLTKRLLANSPGDSDKIIRRSLVQIVDTMLGISRNPSYQPPPSPVRDFYPTRAHLLYAVVGHTLDCNPGGDFGGGNCKDEQTISLPTDFEEISRSIFRIFEGIRKLLLADLHLVIDVDSRGLLVEATQRASLGREAPVEVMLDMIEYLNQSEVYFRKIGESEKGQLLTLINETRMILKETLQAIRGAPGTPEGSQLVISQLFETLKLIYGTDFISGRFYRHIKWDLNSRIEHKGIPTDIQEILRASGRDAAEEFDTTSRASLDRLLEDVSNAQAISQQNIQNFSNFFASGFSEVLKMLREGAIRAHEPTEGPKRPNHRVLSRICVLLASGVSTWPKKIDPKLCEGAVVESIYPGFSEKLRFADLKAALDQRQPLEKHMCTYRDFLRRSMLFGTTQPSTELQLDIGRIRSTTLK